MFDTVATVSGLEQNHVGFWKNGHYDLTPDSM